jgi:hypothetical protein
MGGPEGAGLRAPPLAPEVGTNDYVCHWSDIAPGIIDAGGEVWVSRKGSTLMSNVPCLQLSSARGCDQMARIGYSSEGTLVATVVTDNAVLLFSDGRTTSAKDGSVASDCFSKIHRLSSFAGMLTGGSYLPPLAPEITSNCAQHQLAYVDEIVEVVRRVLEAVWSQMLSDRQLAGQITEIRVFVFVVGFDRRKSPRMFYLDNMSEPPFTIQERRLFRKGNDCEIGGMSHSSGKTEDPSGLIAEYIRKQMKSGRKATLTDTCLAAFCHVARELSRRNPAIGGQVFGALITPDRGYQELQVPGPRGQP